MTGEKNMTQNEKKQKMSIKEILNSLRVVGEENGYSEEKIQTFTDEIVKAYNIIPDFVSDCIRKAEKKRAKQKKQFIS